MSSLLVDLGGTDLKFGISDESELQFKYFRRIPMPKLIASSSYRREIDASSLVSLLLTWINRYLSEFRDIERILISGQMGCWVVGDAESLPKSVISWQDLRSIERFGTRENAVHKFDLNELLARNGREIEPGVPLLGLLTFFDEFNSTHKLRFRSLITLVLEALIGKPSEFIHITDAASSGLIDMRTGKWDDYACSNLLHQVELPEVTQDLIPVGNLIGKGVEVYVGIGDQQASLLGVGISESNVVLNIGTGGQVATIGEFETKFPVKIRPFFGQSTVLTYTHLLSGRFLNLVLDTASYVYQKTFTHDDFNKELEYLSKSTFEYELEECLNKDYLLTIAKELGSTDFLNSAIETMSNQYAKAVKAIGGSDNKQMIFAGGVGQKNSLLTSRIASKLSRSNFLISEAEETTLAGLARLNDSIVNSNH